MRGNDISKALSGVGQKWTRQAKAEEKSASARKFRRTMYSNYRVSLKEICYEHMQEAWDKASDNGRLPTHWRQVFYVMRPICEADEDSDRALIDSTFKNILESYLREMEPGWDVLRGARGVFKEPHSAEDDNGLAMSTMNVRTYLGAQTPDSALDLIPSRFPTKGARNRIAAVLICEKEGFDELLQAEQVPERFDLALMSTKGISAIAARDLASTLGVPCLKLHDLDKNGFVMAGGFPFATDIGLRLEDVNEWDLEPESQFHKSPGKTRTNVMQNGATKEEAEFIAGGQRVELNMLSGPDFIAFVEAKLRDNGVEKVIPDEETLTAAWARAHTARKVNEVITSTWTSDEGNEPPTTDRGVPDPPADLSTQVRQALDAKPEISWDEALWKIAHEDGGET